MSFFFFSNCSFDIMLQRDAQNKFYIAPSHMHDSFLRIKKCKTSKPFGHQQIHTSAAALGRLPGWHCRPESRWSTSRRSDTCRQQGHIWVNWSQHTRAQANRHTESSTAQERRTRGRAEIGTQQTGQGRAQVSIQTHKWTLHQNMKVCLFMH